VKTTLKYNNEHHMSYLQIYIRFVTHSDRQPDMKSIAIYMHKY